MCSYPCLGLSKTGFTPPSQLLKLINFFLKKPKPRRCRFRNRQPKLCRCRCRNRRQNCVAANQEIGSENFVINYIYIYILLGVYRFPEAVFLRVATEWLVGDEDVWSPVLEYRLKRAITFDSTIGSCSKFYRGFQRLFSLG